MSIADVETEQAYVSMLYGRLDRLRDRAAGRLSDTLITEVASVEQGMSERDSAAAEWSRRVAQLDAAEHGLCFGRLDLDGGEARYVGRLGIVDDDGDYEPLLLDWRAPAARPFYVATAARPEGVRRRRHIRTRLRQVTRVDDETLDLSDPAAAGEDSGPAGEAALLAALGAARTGRMADIVETIQAEQDHVIRAPHGGVLVVQGGAGTGKTAVALHRAAYLLYTYRQQLERRGVLVVGPNPTFLRYIGEVLPALGETGVVLAPVERLFPGVTADRTEPEEVAEVKGRAAMAEVLATAVKDRQHVPDGALRLEIDGDPVRIPAAAIRRARTTARRTRRPHNEARPVFAEQFVAAVAAEYAADLGERSGAGRSLAGVAGELDLDLLTAQLAEHPAVLDALDELWPGLTPQRFLAELLGSRTRLAAAGLSEVDAALLHRRPGGWTGADVPLLDEAAELLGVDDRVARALEQARRREEIEQAQDVLDILAGSRSHELEDLDDLGDSEGLSAVDLIDAERLAERHGEVDDRTLAERAYDDRSWAYGHVVVDEAQELSAMAWRLLMRRCPSRSMTLVGDVAQTGDLAGTTSWQQVLEPYVGTRWRLERLTVNYRNPAEVMAVAAGVLAALDPPVEPPRSVRETGERPWTAAFDPAALPALVRNEQAAVGAGRVAVLVPAARSDQVREALGLTAEQDLTEPVVVLPVRAAKGLEFDSVLVVDPAGILAESPRGANDLYVALTRSTRRLGVLAAGPLPAMLTGLVPVGEVGRPAGDRVGAAS